MLRVPAMVENKKRWWTSLFVQLLVAVVAGVLIGHFWPSFGVSWYLASAFEAFWAKAGFTVMTPAASE